MGEVLMRLDGQVIVDDESSYEGTDVEVAMLWSVDLDRSSVSQAAVVRTSFPARYTLEIYQPPPPSALLPLFGDPDFQAAVGMPVLFVDHSGDKVWDPSTEPLVGGSFDVAVLYAETVPEWTEDEYGWSPRELSAVSVLRDPCGQEFVDPDVYGDQAGTDDDSLDVVALEPLEVPRTNLYVGYIWPALWDWDCDGNEEEWENPDHTIEVNEECPPPELMEEECRQLQDQVDQELADGTPLDPARYAWLLEDPVWFGCLEATCPETVMLIQEAASFP